MPLEAQSLLKATTVDEAAQAVQALFQFLKGQGSATGAKQPLRSIQEPDSPAVLAALSSQSHLPALQLQQAKKAAEAMNTEELHHQLAQVYQAYNSHVAVQGIDTADFLHLLADCQLLTNRFGLLEGQEVYQAAWAATTAASRHKALGLSEDGLEDALRRVAAVKLSKLSNLDEAFRRLLCHWVFAHMHSKGPAAAPPKDLVARHDAMLKKVFAWYASLPSLAGMLSVRQVTGLLQQYNAEAPAQDGVLQYPHLLDMLSRCAVLLRQQLNSLKRYLKLQSLPSIQEAYALPDSPHHVATITGSLQKMQLVQPTHLAAQWPQCQAQQIPVSSRSTSPAQVMHQNPTLRRPLHRNKSRSAASGSIAAHAANWQGRQGSRLGFRVGKSGWDATGVETQMMSSLSSSVGSAEEEWYWREQDRLWLEAQQQEVCRNHLAWREGDKRRLLQHRQERLSYDPRMPARLASFPCHMACNPTPPYALLDTAAHTPTTALNMDGDGWCPVVDVVRLECPSPVSSIEAEEDTVEPARPGQLPMLSLKHVPLDTLSAGTSKLGKRTREMAWAHDTCDQLAAFDGRLPSLLADWSIEQESQQWAQAIKDATTLPTVPSACCNK
ncbi:MAG: hypothetical protein FRX49_04995 [Trebouxia sp. A1-2]|nr:MAG: hypothetical protein FRX49_04995 [Trebouxia sp. A1-2]